MPEKQRGLILSFQLLNYFLYWFAYRVWNILLCEKYSAIIRWTPRNVTALQVVKTSFLGPRPLSFPLLVPALRSAQNKVSREYTPYIYTFTARSLSIENFSDSSNTLRGSMMLPLRKRSDLATLARWQFNNVAYFVFFQFCWKSFCRQKRLDDGSVISRAS